MHRWVTGLVLLVASLIAPWVATAQSIHGQVRSSAPLAGVAVQAELDGHALALITTGVDGRFSLMLTGAKDSSDLRVSFVKAGFRQENRLLSVGSASAKALDIVLEPLTGSGAISPAEKALWDAHRTSSGDGPLMFVPYALSGGAAGQASDINARLVFNCSASSALDYRQCCRMPRRRRLY